MQITDELIARYLEGKVTETERKAVESYLSENEEEMDLLFAARAEMAYQDDIAQQSVFARSMIEHDEYALAAASEKMDCAIKAQQMVLRNYGIEASVGGPRRKAGLRKGRAVHSTSWASCSTTTAWNPYRCAMRVSIISCTN